MLFFYVFFYFSGVLSVCAMRLTYFYLFNLVKGSNMKTKLLPIAIGAVLAGGMTAASADLTVFGHIDTSITSVDVDVDGGEFGVTEFSDNYDDVNMGCTTCSIGFKGSEDLGNGLKAIFKLDFQYDTTVRNDGDGSGGDGDNDNSGLLDRDQWLGLAGDNFGKVRVGSISTGYKSHGAMIDPLYRTAAQARGVGLQSSLHSGAGEEGQGRATNTVRWDSPNWNGVKVVAHYTLDSDESDDEDNNPFGFGASYSNGGILVFADYLTNDGNNDPDQNELTAWKVGGKYAMDNFSVFAQYEDMDDDFVSDDEFLGVEINGTVTADVSAELWHIGGTYTMGNNMLYVAYGQADADVDEVGGGVSANVEYDTFTIAGVHSMSKRTIIYAAHNNFDGEYDDSDDFFGNLESDIFAVGMKHKF